MTEMRKYMLMNCYTNIVDFTSEEEVMDFFKVLICSFVVVAQDVKRSDLAARQR
jgi:transcription elongation factor GreA-like protein